MLSKIDFGKILQSKIKNGDDPVFLSDWAYKIYLGNSRSLESGLKDFILNLGMMSDEPEFSYTYAELIGLANSLESGRG
ncbi:MAG: hypothetical protein GZ090_07460 [Oxalobacteraceae bacterium]|nr:hypothetical protein [Oxalobacteraceae bacterium]